MATTGGVYRLKSNKGVEVYVLASLPLFAFWACIVRVEVKMARVLNSQRRAGIAATTSWLCQLGEEKCVLVADRGLVESVSNESFKEWLGLPLQNALMFFNNHAQGARPVCIEARLSA